MNGGSLEDKLDALVSELVRRLHTDASGCGECYTCSTFGHWKEMDAGHFVRRAHRATRWDWRRNLRRQCKECNQVNGGEEAAFRERLVDELGEEEVLKIEQGAYDIVKVDDDWLREQIAEVKAELAKL